jgi:hypothetical protein
LTIRRAAVSKDGRTEELSAERILETADEVNGGVRVRRESLVDCAFKEAVDADRRANGDCVKLGRCSSAGRLDWSVDCAMEAENWSIRAKVVVSVTERVCS